MVACLRQQVIIAGAEGIHQPQPLGLTCQPVLTGRDLIDIELRAVFGHKGLEALVDRRQLLAKLLAPQIVVLAKHGDGALVLTGGVHLEFDVVLFQQLVEVRQLGDHPDGTDDGKGGSQDLVRHTSHHVAAARRHLIDSHGELDVTIAQSLQLGSGQAIAMHHAATGFESQQYLVAGLGDANHRAHLLAQGGHLFGIHAAVEIEHEQAAALITGLGALFLLLFLLLFHHLALGLAGKRALERKLPLLQLAREIGHHQLTLARFRLASADNHQDDGADGQQEGHCLGQKQAIFGQKCHDGLQNGSVFVTF